MTPKKISEDYQELCYWYKHLIKQHAKLQEDAKELCKINNECLARLRQYSQHQTDVEELHQELQIKRRKVMAQEHMLSYYKANMYSIRKRNHFLVISNRIYMAADFILILLFVVWLLFM